MTQYKHTQKSKLTLNQSKKVKRIEERLSQMIQMKTQLGHKPLNFFGNRLWYPEMAQSFLGIRDGVTIIDPEVTLKATAEGLYFASLILRNQGRLLLVDSRHEFSPFSQLAAKYADKLEPSIAIAGNRWIGGTLTNWSSISTHVSQFGFITSMFKPFVNSFRVTSPRYKKMKDAFPGFLTVSSANQLQHMSGSTKPQLKFRQRPDLLIVCRPQENFLLLREAFRLQIPVLAFVDSNTSLDYITFPIPVNTENHEWMYYSLNLLSRLAQKFHKSGKV
jgi:small subunit ribosomal protein S2